MGHDKNAIHVIPGINSDRRVMEDTIELAPSSDVKPFDRNLKLSNQKR
jgi:hypothetical protein